MDDWRRLDEYRQSRLEALSREAALANLLTGRQWEPGQYRAALAMAAVILVGMVLWWLL